MRLLCLRLAAALMVAASPTACGWSVGQDDVLDGAADAPADRASPPADSAPDAQPDAQPDASPDVPVPGADCAHAAITPASRSGCTVATPEGARRLAIASSATTRRTPASSSM